MDAQIHVRTAKVVLLPQETYWYRTAVALAVLLPYFDPQKTHLVLKNSKIKAAFSVVTSQPRHNSCGKTSPYDGAAGKIGHKCCMRIM